MSNETGTSRTRGSERFQKAKDFPARKSLFLGRRVDDSASFKYADRYRLTTKARKRKESFIAEFREYRISLRIPRIRALIYQQSETDNSEVGLCLRCARSALDLSARCCVSS